MIVPRVRISKALLKNVHVPLLHICSAVLGLRALEAKLVDLFALVMFLLLEPSGNCVSGTNGTWQFLQVLLGTAWRYRTPLGDFPFFLKND